MKQEQEKCCCFVNVTILTNNKLYNVKCKVKELMINVWHSFVFYYYYVLNKTLKCIFLSSSYNTFQ